MATQVGYPYNQIPTEAFINAAGGYGQASLCGALGVAGACAGSVCDGDTAKKVMYELSEWYKTAEFPYYQPDGLGLPTTVSESTLCEVSVNKFMDVHGCAYGDDDRKTRCAGVTADVTRKLVEILNAQLT